jgi:hypothetical protein
MLELTDGQRERVKELQVLADEAEGGDRGARVRLRRELRDSAPEVIARCSDTATSYRGLLAKTASGGNKLVQDAIVERSRLVALELPGRTPRRSRCCYRRGSRPFGCLWSCRRR